MHPGGGTKKENVPHSPRFVTKIMKSARRRPTPRRGARQAEAPRGKIRPDHEDAALGHGHGDVGQRDVGAFQEGYMSVPVQKFPGAPVDGSPENRNVNRTSFSKFGAGAGAFFGHAPAPLGPALICIIKRRFRPLICRIPLFRTLFRSGAMQF